MLQQLSYMLYVTGFAITVHKYTRDEIQITAAELYIEATLSHYPDTLSSYMDVDGQVCYYRQLFANPVKPQGCTTGPLVPLRGTIKTVCSAKLLAMTIWAY